MTLNSWAQINPAQIKTQWLTNYITVCQEAQFDKAAAKLGVSRQTVQRQIKQLENHLKTALLVKQTKTLEPTASGRLFLQTARELLEALQNVENRLQNVSEHLNGPIAFAWQSASSFYFLPQTLAAFIGQQPKVFLSIQCEAQTERISQRLISGNLDLAMMDTSVPSDDLLCVGSGRSPYVIIARPQATTHWSSLDYVLPQLASPNPRQQLWDDQNYPRRVICQTDSFDALLDWCLSGRAASYLPQITVQRYLDLGQLAIVANPPVPSYKELFLYSSIAASQRTAVQALIQAIKRQLPVA